MSMLDYNPEAPTVAQSTADRLLRALDREIQRRISLHQQMFALVWRSEEATPDDIVAAMGTKAAAFFDFANENVAHIARGAALVGETLATYLRPEDYEPPRVATRNADGTVTLGE